MVIRPDRHHIVESARPDAAVILFLHIKLDIRSKDIGGYVALMMDVPSIGALRALIAEYVISIGNA
jgi:chemotaxis protein CheC